MLAALCAAFGVPAQRRAARADQSTVRTRHLPPAKAKLKPVWQAAPSGIGEYLPFPDREALGIFQWGKRTLVGTWNGLLSSTTPGRWHIVPGLYGRAVRPLGEKNGLLWLQEMGLGLLAVDQKFAIRHTFYTVQGQGIQNFDIDSFWRLDETILRGNWWWEQDRSTLVELTAEGRERLRIPTHFFPGGVPQWMAIDAAAVWLALLDFPEMEFYGGPPRQPRPARKQLIRLDRGTGKMTAVDIQGRIGSAVPVFLNLPERILWVAPGHDKRLALHQLDKKRLRTVTAMRFRTPIFARNLAADSRNLWVFPGASATGTPLVFALRDFKPVPIRAAGNLPPGAPAPGSYEKPTSATTWYEVVAGDKHHVWLRTSGPAVIELRDDGTALTRNLSTIMQFPAGTQCFELRHEKGQIYNVVEWKNDEWELRGRGALPRIRSGPLVATQRYLYFKTALGLYRVAWAQLDGNSGD